jgi:tRNA (mo5U34)-methyltransferase
VEKYFLNINRTYYNEIIHYGKLDDEPIQRIDDFIKKNNVQKILLYGKGTTAEFIKSIFSDYITAEINSVSIDKIHTIDFDCIFLAMSPIHYHAVTQTLMKLSLNEMRVVYLFEEPQNMKVADLVINDETWLVKGHGILLEKTDTSHIDKKYLLNRLEELKPWYHRIDLGGGIITPGLKWEHIWNPIRQLMSSVNYSKKKVLDLASWDGMWAFEAENMGASMVVSTDIRKEGYDNLLFIREVLQSKIIPLCNVPVQELNERMKIVGMPEKYDIIHHFGLLYHLRDPLLSLAQAREMIDENGILLLETAFINDDKNSCMWFSGVPGNYHIGSSSDTWFITKLCLKEILIRSFFQPMNEDKWQYADMGKNKMGRISIMAKPIPREDGERVDRLKTFGAQ